MTKAQSLRVDLEKAVARLDEALALPKRQNLNWRVYQQCVAVTTAKAGVQSLPPGLNRGQPLEPSALDSRFRGNDA